MPDIVEARGISLSLRAPSLFGGGKSTEILSNVSLSVKSGEVLGIVGESGSGKSTIARVLLGLQPPTAGSVTVDGRNRREATVKELAPLIQPVFQDPFSSLNPSQSIVDIVALPLDLHRPTSTKAQRQFQAVDMLERCGLQSYLSRRLPRELTGGQRQRVAIARALVLQPKIVVFDEPTSALDISVQAKILNLLRELRRDFALAYVFIGHNLGVISYLADNVMVMRAGKVVEAGPVKSVLARPTTEYTRALIAAVLRLPNQLPEV
ncbi:ABC transporter ATP-binding protein [Pseudomonas stutzeri]|nr:ABC transporter ATP-binding protein [Stutzerimonas stutzeri]